MFIVNKIERNIGRLGLEVAARIENCCQRKPLKFKSRSQIANLSLIFRAVPT